MITKSNKWLVFDTFIDKLIVLARKYMLIGFVEDPFDFFFGISNIRHIMLRMTGGHALFAFTFFLLIQAFAHVNNHCPFFYICNRGNFFRHGSFQFPGGENIKCRFAAQPEKGIAVLVSSEMLDEASDIITAREELDAHILANPEDREFDDDDEDELSGPGLDDDTVEDEDMFFHRDPFGDADDRF